MGKRLKGQFPERDAELVSRGLRDALAGDKLLFTEGELKAALAAAVQYEVQTSALKRVIPGWREALQLMPVGSKWQIFVPPDLAYGPKGARGTIGPNATLVFDVELLSIKDKPTAATPRQTPPQSVASDKSPRS